jgi:glyoxylate reductase
MYNFWGFISPRIAERRKHFETRNISHVTTMDTPDTPLALLTYNLPPDWICSLEGQVRLVTPPPGRRGFTPELQAHYAEAEGLFSMLTDRVDGDLLARMPRLKVVSNMAVGVDNIDLDACRRRGIPVGHTPGVLTAATADMAMALLLAAARLIPQAGLDAREGRWGPWDVQAWLGADLDGATLGIVGLGKIGAAIAARGRGFGLQIAYCARSRKPEAEAALGAVRLDLPALLQTSDFVVLAVDLNDSTHGLIGAAELEMMKDSAILVNIARGPVVLTDALVRALQEKRIGGAALDVSDPEPLPPAHPLYSLPNCLITPHIGSATTGARRGMAELACQNLLAGLKGESLRNAVP